MSDHPKLNALLRRVEPLAAVLRDLGMRPVDASMVASALVHSRYVDRVEGLRDLVCDMPPAVDDLVRFRAAEAFQGGDAPSPQLLRAAEAMLEILRSKAT